MFGELHAGRLGVQDCPELHRVQVPPTTRCNVVIHRTRLSAFGAWERGAFGMFDGDVNLLCLGIELNVNNEPRLIDPKNLLVEFAFLHRCSPWKTILPNPQTSRMNLIYAGSFTVVSGNNGRPTTWRNTPAENEKPQYK